MPKQKRSRRILVSAPDELYEVLAAAAAATNQPLASFIRSWLEESAPAIKQIIAAIEIAHNKGTKHAMLNFGAAMAQELGKGHEQMALLMQDAQNLSDERPIISQEAKTTPKRRRAK